MSPFFRLTAGRSITVFGQTLGMTTLTLWMAYQSQSIYGASIIQSATPILSLLVLPFSGTVADQFEHRKIIVWSDLLAGLFILLISSGLYFYSSAPLWGWVAILVGYLGYQMCGLFFAPAMEALFAQIATSEGRGKLNSLHRGFVQVSTVGGQSLSGVLYSLLGPSALMATNALAIFASAGLEVGLPKTRGSTSRDSWWGRLKGGFTYVRSNPPVRQILWFSVIINTAIAPTFLVLPFFMRKTLASSEAHYGYAMALFTIGQLVGSFGLAPRLMSFALRRVLTALTMLLALTVASIALGTSMEILFAQLFVMGALIAPIGIVTMTELQNEIDHAYTGRVMALAIALSQCLIPLFSFLGAHLINRELVSHETMILASSFLLGLQALFMYVFSRGRKPSDGV